MGYKLHGHCIFFILAGNQDMHNSLDGIIRLYFKLREVNQIDKKFDSKFNSAIGYTKSTKLLW